MPCGLFDFRLLICFVIVPPQQWELISCFERDWTCCLKFWCLQLHTTLFLPLNSVSFLLWKYLQILLSSRYWLIFLRELSVLPLRMEKKEDIKRKRGLLTRLKSISNNWYCHKELVPQLLVVTTIWIITLCIKTQLVGLHAPIVEWEQYLTNSTCTFWYKDYETLNVVSLLASAYQESHARYAQRTAIDSYNWKSKAKAEAVIITKSIIHPTRINGTDIGFGPSSKGVTTSLLKKHGEKGAMIC